MSSIQPAEIVNDETYWMGSTDSEQLYANYDHRAPLLGLDGTPSSYYMTVRDAAVAADEPVGWSEKYGGFWVVTGYEECMEIMRSPDVFSNTGVIFPKYAVTEPLMLAEQDEPEHMRARRLVNLAFMPKNVSLLDGQIRDATNGLIDGIIENGAADLGKVIADPLPAIVTTGIMGFPVEHGPTFLDWANAATSEFFTNPEAAKPKLEAMYEYFEENVARRIKEPGPDLLSSVINSVVDGERLTREELMGFSTVLLIGGIENSSKLLGSAMWRLAWDVELRARLIENPALIPAAVEELLRIYTPASDGRKVMQDTVVGGKEMKAGQQVMLALQIANRDPSVFTYPDSIALDRPKGKHLALGSGLHVCLGQHLIRLEAQLVITEFLKRIPNFRVDPSKRAEWVQGHQVSGMFRVPVLFEPGQPLQKERAPGVEAWLRYAEQA